MNAPTQPISSSEVDSDQTMALTESCGWISTKMLV